MAHPNTLNDTPRPSRTRSASAPKSHHPRGLTHYLLPHVERRRLGVREGIGAGLNPDRQSLTCASTASLKLVALRTGFDCPEGASRDLLYRRNARQGHDFRLGLSYECRRG